MHGKPYTVWDFSGGFTEALVTVSRVAAHKCIKMQWATLTAQGGLSKRKSRRSVALVIAFLKGKKG
jgi:hypothetical protein